MIASQADDSVQDDERGGRSIGFGLPLAARPCETRDAILLSAGTGRLRWCLVNPSAGDPLLRQAGSANDGARGWA